MAQPDLISIVTYDMAATVQFYRLIGLDIPAGAEKEDHVEYVTPGGFRIGWDTLEVMRSIHPEWVEPAGFRAIIAFKCASPAEVDQLYEKVVESGYVSNKPPWNAFWGQRYAVVVDPDGNLVDLFAAL